MAWVTIELTDDELASLASDARLRGRTVEEELGALVRLRRVLWDPGARRLCELVDEIWQRGGVVAIFEEIGVRAIEEARGRYGVPAGRTPTSRS